MTKDNIMGHDHEGGCHFCSFLPPHLVERLNESDDPALRRLALTTVRLDAAARTRREVMPARIMGGSMLPGSGRRRTICDMDGREGPLPGAIKRKEGTAATGDAAVDAAYDHAGVTYEFYKKLFERESLDDAGYPLIASVHFGFEVANAFWDGQRMIYGDGDGHYFLPFTRSLAIAAHEISHGVINFTSDLVYQDQSGALNESFCDTMAAAVVQWNEKKSVADATWTMGGEIFGPEMGKVAGIRSFTEEPAYMGHPILGDDIQPKHMANYVVTSQDNGGVHINSGIPNHAFYRVAQALGGNVWEKTAKIWYVAFTQELAKHASFAQAAAATIATARRLFGDEEAAAVAAAWEAVGVKSED